MTKSRHLPPSPVRSIQIGGAGTKKEDPGPARDVQEEIRPSVTEIKRVDDRYRPSGRFRIPK
jgi:hypothetical protein